MRKKINLLELIAMHPDDINNYLGSVETVEFIEDVKYTLQQNVPQQVIQDTINKLQTLIK